MQRIIISAFGILCLVFAIYCTETKNSTQSNANKSEVFKIYWNVPTHLCKNHIKHNVTFDQLLTELNIIHNINDSFRGEKFNILYSPGLWPSLEHNKSVNGEMPHHGNLSLHLTELKNYVNHNISDNFTGLAVIDMESWRPIFRQNTGWMTIYRERVFDEQFEGNLKELDKEENKSFRNYIFKKAAEIFEPMAKMFMNESIALVKKLKSNAHWGYYGFPYCFNMRSNDRNESCPEIVQKENNRTDWLFKSYDYWFPSVYISNDNFTEDERRQLVSGRVTEYNRVRKFSNSKAEIYPYVWFLYNLRDEYLNATDMKMTLETLKNGTMNGAVIWGSSANIKNETMCQNLYNYVNGTLRSVLQELKLINNSLQV
ncbi:hyaluronidase-like [Phlebotomus argentipes]|uniref:hyaluronidase-like n=1 Tax=Phlebotomus argentipes TaxID=94469 RepID=UPI00289330B7|nr:hyaluronidase-like [Phlebotomus argentipes]